MNITLYVGLIGAGLILLAFILHLLKVLDREHTEYLVMNFIGSGAMTYYSWATNTMPFLVLNGVWTLFSLYGIIKYYSKENKQKDDMQKTDAQKSDMQKN